MTDADHASEDILLASLAALMPGVPVISEEQAAANNFPETAGTYFVVDPLDGTKEFVKLNGEFCINVGLVSGGKAIFGLLFGPAKGDCFVTLAPGKAYRCEMQPAHNPPLKGSFDFTPLTGERRRTGPSPRLSAARISSRTRPLSLKATEIPGH